MVRRLVPVPDAPPPAADCVTTTSRVPSAAFDATDVMTTVTWLVLTNVVDPSVRPVPEKVTTQFERKLAPFTVIVTLASPCFTAVGADSEVTVGVGALT